MPDPGTEPSAFGVDLLWIPLGAGGVGFVRMNGRIYEAILAHRQHRGPLDLYHTALEVHVPEGRFVVENAWPSPDGDTALRGVVVEGPVFNRRIARFRPFRYEIRCWRGGVIADAADAVGGRHRVSGHLDAARRLLSLVETVPAMTWGRDDLGAGEMWNSNSVISWLLARSALLSDAVRPPAGGRAPGWDAGILGAQRSDGIAFPGDEVANAEPIVGWMEHVDHPE